NGTGDGIPIGQPIANTEIYLLDRDGQPAPIGVTGEMYIGGLGVVRGYLNRPELTAERFVPHAFTDRADARLYRTGDLVRYREDGVIDFLGRVDHQVKVRGYRIELGEIESRLTEHPGVAEAIVIAKGEGDDRRLVGYIVADGEALPPGTEELKAHLQQTLPEFMIPGHIVVLDRLPLTPNAKVDRQALPDPETVVGNTTPDIAFVPPTSDIEQRLAAVWQDVLKVPQIGLEDNFFDLGGHSLLVVQTHRRLKDDLHLELSITDMFRFPTVRSLASFLDGGGSDTAGVEQGVSRAAGRRAALKRRRGQRA
ncbi:MAG: phosphopantetheine-binding protein, partial [Gemmatimonadales bacterium]